MKPLSELLDAELSKVEQILILNKEALLAYRDAFSKEEQKKFNRAVAQFDEAAAIVLGDILAREQSGDIPTAKRERLINAFALACTAYADARNVNREALDRLTAKLRTQKGRSSRTSDSAKVRKAVRESAERAWSKKPKLRNNARATAIEIQRNNPMLKDHKLDTIRKHVGEFQRETRRQP